jgi:hypothetical protein
MRAAIRVEILSNPEVTDVRSTWTEIWAVQNEAQKWVFAALVDISEGFRFPSVGIDSDNGSEFINAHLLEHCVQHKITFTCSRAGTQERGCSCGAERPTSMGVQVSPGDTHTPMSVPSRVGQPDSLSPSMTTTA